PAQVSAAGTFRFGEVYRPGRLCGRCGRAGRAPGGFWRISPSDNEPGHLTIRARKLNWGVRGRGPQFASVHSGVWAMTDCSRLRVVGASLALIAVLTSSDVWGDSAKRTTDAFRSSTGQITPEKGDRSLTEDLALSKFSQGGMVTYKSTTGDTLFAMQ